MIANMIHSQAVALESLVEQLDLEPLTSMSGHTLGAADCLFNDTGTATAETISCSACAAIRLTWHRP